MLYAKNENVGCLKLLLNSGAKIDLQDIVRHWINLVFTISCLFYSLPFKNGKTALLYACHERRKHSIEILLRHGANPNIANRVIML
jgi:hypothetical protein